MPGLPSDRSVIALWEVDEVTRTPLPRTARACHASSIISETCLPGEGDLFCVNEDAGGYVLMGGVIVCCLTGGNVSARAGP